MKPSLSTHNVIEMRPLRQYLPRKASPNQGTITRHCLRHISCFGMEVVGKVTLASGYGELRHASVENVDPGFQSSSKAI